MPNAAAPDRSAERGRGSPPRFSTLDREGAEAAQLHPVAPGQRIRDGVEDRVDQDLDVALVEMRVLLGDLEDELRLDHGVWSSRGIGAGDWTALSGGAQG